MDTIPDTTAWGRAILAHIAEKDRVIAAQAQRLTTQAAMISNLRDDLEAAQRDLTQAQIDLSVARAMQCEAQTQLSLTRAIVLAKDAGIAALQQHIAMLTQVERAA